MSAVHEVVVPRLHLTLSEVRAELLDVHALAVELANALDREVDARLGHRGVNSGQTAAALLHARRMGVL